MKIAVVAVVLLSACASIPNTSKIERGQTMDQVRSQLGNPEVRQFAGNKEVWQWCATGTSFGTSSYQAIRFTDGKVDALKSYTRHAPGVCSAHFVEFKLDDSPDYALEVRNR